MPKAVIQNNLPTTSTTFLTEETHGEDLLYIAIQSLWKQVSTNSGIAQCIRVVSHALAELFPDLIVQIHDIEDINVLLSVSQQKHLVNPRMMAQLLYRVLYQDIVQSVGVMRAKEIVEQSYGEFEKKYSEEQVRHLLDILPIELLGHERLRMLQRDQEMHATQGLKATQETLEEKVGDLSRTRLALINLLEDSRVLEGELLFERDRFQAIISSMGEALVVTDETFRITSINLAAQKLLRVTNEVEGMNWFDICTILKGKTVLPEEDRLEKKTLTSQKPIEFLLNDGFSFRINAVEKNIPVAGVMAPLKGQDIKGLVIVFHDITEDKELDESKLSFISTASHQLRTPLTSIRWFAEMLTDGAAGKLNKEQTEYINWITQGIERMINLVNLLLQLARVEAGRVRIEPIPVDFNVLTKDVIMTMQTQAKEKGVTIKTSSLPKQLPMIPMDRDIAWQVIQNLVSNAIRYSLKKGKILITMEADTKKKRLVYSVKDTGIGIPKNAQGKIFEKFFRADNAIVNVPEGSGLGLSLAKRVVEDWGGTLSFTSVENKGTTFFFTVPLKGVKPKEGEVKLTV
ncbi:MAG: ATP-binding protein [Patescibacteria group bacterium]